MKVLACIKQIPDNMSLTYNVDTGKMENLSYVMNSTDEVAVEEAVRIKDKLGEVEVTVLTVGPPRAEDVLRRSLTRGADRAILLWDKLFENVSAHAVSVILAKAIRNSSYDIIFCGLGSGDEDNHFVGVHIANILDIPYISGVVRLEVTPDKKHVVIQRRLEKGERETVEISLPAVMGVDPNLNKPMYLSRRRLEAAARKPIIKQDAASLSIEPQDIKSMTTYLEFSQPKPRLKKGFTIDSSLPASERIGLILSGGGSKREKMRIMEKSPEESALALFNFLSEKDLLQRE